jgi:hypothetical protein
MATYTEESSNFLTEYESQVAHYVAQILAEEQISINKIKDAKDGIKTELEKIITYLYAKTNNHENKSKNNPVDDLFDYLNHLVKYGKQVGHTDNTIKYDEYILDVCYQYFDSKQDKAITVLTILGWSARLFKFYKQKIESGEELPPIQAVTRPTSKTQNIAIEASSNFQIEQIIDATVIKINGIKVSYQVGNIFIRNEKEHKYATKLKEKQNVKVKITAINDDGSIKHVKYLSD